MQQFERHGVYVHGSLDELHRITGWHGRRVLYFGDQLYTDLVEPGKWRGWRTGAIIRELENEVATQNTVRGCRCLFFCSVIVCACFEKCSFAKSL